MAILTFLSILVPWFLSSIVFPFNPEFYNNLNLPNFTPPNIIFAIVWSIVYILIALSIYLILKQNKGNKSYLFSILTNYIFNQSFSLFFFYFQNLTLTLYTIFLLLASTIYFIKETKKISNTSFYLLIFYLLWVIFATILFTTIYFIN